VSFECGRHGWRHLLNPCPSCASDLVYSANTASISGLKPTPADDGRDELIRELIDNCLASTAEEGVSSERIRYRKELYERAVKVFRRN